jgi:hypothetical protein
MENAQVDIPMPHYMHQSLKMGINAWGLIDFIAGGYSLSLCSWWGLRLVNSSNAKRNPSENRGPNLKYPWYSV